MNRTQQPSDAQQQSLTPRQRRRQPLSLGTELILPGWEQLPKGRRHRLVALLGELVRRRQAQREEVDDGA